MLGCCSGRFVSMLPLFHSVWLVLLYLSPTRVVTGFGPTIIYKSNRSDCRRYCASGGRPDITQSSSPGEFLIHCPPQTAVGTSPSNEEHSETPAGPSTCTRIESSSSIENQSSPHIPIISTNKDRTQKRTDDDRNNKNYSASPQHQSSWSKGSSSFWKREDVGPVFGWMCGCALVACLVIQWEDVTSTYVLPSRRHRIESLQLLMQERGEPTSPFHPHLPWGASTIRGMGFGASERQLILLSSLASNEAQEETAARTSTKTELDERQEDLQSVLIATLPSYNEVMEQHRTVTVPRWTLTEQQQQQLTLQQRQEQQLSAAAAIHTMVTSLQQVWKLQAVAQEYQWNEIRLQLHTTPLRDLSTASAVLRQQANFQHNNNNDINNKDADLLLAQLKSVVGFDWGSCAWRHNACGAVADAQEALDELDMLLGVLEPYEAVFCLDIVERSLRDILAVLPWDQAIADDRDFYRHRLPAYVSRVSTATPGGSTDSRTSDDEDEVMSRIDNEYFRALRELRID